MSVVIDSKSGNRIAKTTSPFLLVLDRNEMIHDAILQCAKAANIHAASISGLGAFEDPVIAYYNLQTKKYEEKTFKGIFELISLNGNIAQTEEGELVVHLHCTIGDEHHHVFGGHLISSKVGITAEVTIVPLQGPMIRKMNDAMGLKLICSYLS